MEICTRKQCDLTWQRVHTYSVLLSTLTLSGESFVAPSGWLLGSDNPGWDGIVIREAKSENEARSMVMKLKNVEEDGIFFRMREKSE